MKAILVFDPGESTGWVFRRADGTLDGGTCPKDHTKVAELLHKYMPEIVVFESFRLYPQKAQSLAWNSFYPCEVIGVIKYLCMVDDVPTVEQAPSVKKYFGGFQQDWDRLKESSVNITEHTKDAYQLLRYFERNGLKRFQEAR